MGKIRIKTKGLRDSNDKVCIDNPHKLRISSGYLKNGSFEAPRTEERMIIPYGIWLMREENGKANMRQIHIENEKIATIRIL